MFDPLVLYSLVGIAILLSAVAAAGAWRSQRGGGVTEAALDQRLAELKGGLISELARTRAAVESGMHDSGEAYVEAQDLLVKQVDQAVVRLRGELLAANEESCRMVQAALEKVFAKAQSVQDLSLEDQAHLLKDLKGNYERAIADLRAAVNQASARHNEALLATTEQIREAMIVLAGDIRQTTAANAALAERVESTLQVVEGRVA